MNRQELINNIWEHARTGRGVWARLADWSGKRDEYKPTVIWPRR